MRQDKERAREGGRKGGRDGGRRMRETNGEANWGEGREGGEEEEDESFC